MPSLPGTDAPRVGATLGQLLRFGTVGAISTAIHAAIASAYLFAVGGSALQANLLGFCGAFLWSFAGNLYWVFRYRGHVRDVFPRFLTLSLATLAVSSAISLVADRLGLNPLWALAVVVLTIPALSYLANRFWVFR